MGGGWRSEGYVRSNGLSLSALFLPASRPTRKPGVYRDLMRPRGPAAPRIRGSGISLPSSTTMTVHLARFTHGVIRQPATISVGFRELIAAYTSYQKNVRSAPRRTPPLRANCSGKRRGLGRTA